MTTTSVVRRHAHANVAGKNVLYIVSNPTAALEPFAIRDGQIITGQQQHSTRLFSDLLIEALSE
jgi:putative intracellular protease/amidase